MARLTRFFVAITLLWVAEVFSYRALDLLASRAPAGGLLHAIVGETNLPFLSAWAVVGFALGRRYVGRGQAAARTDDALPRRTAAALVVTCGVVLAFLYAPAVAIVVRRSVALPWWPRVLEACVVTPLVEEYLFRVVFVEAARGAGTALGHRMGGLFVAVTSSIAFACWHLAFNDHAFIAHFLFGLAMWMLRSATRSVTPCIVVHSIANLLSAAAFES